MRSLKTGFVAVVAGTLLLGAGGGLVSAQSPARTITEAPAVRSPVGVEGHYCADISGGSVWVPDGRQVAGTYCAPTTPPAYTAPTGGGIFVPESGQSDPPTE